MRLNWGWPVKAVYGLPLVDSATRLCIYSLVLLPLLLFFCPACTCSSLGQFNWESCAFEAPTLLWHDGVHIKHPLLQSDVELNSSLSACLCKVYLIALSSATKWQNVKQERNPDFLFNVEITIDLILSFNINIYLPNNCTLNKGSSAIQPSSVKQIR